MNPQSIIALISFAPALFLLYFVLGEYDPYFKHNKAFFMIAFGLLVGLIIGFITLYFPLGDLIWMLGIVLVLELIKFVMLLQKPFRLKHDATFYGLAFGIGLPAMMVFVYGYFSGLLDISIKLALFFSLVSYNYTMVHASTGSLIGFGCYRGEFWTWFIRAFIISGVHGSLMAIVWAGDVSETGQFAVLTLGAVYATFLLLYIVKEILPRTVPKKIKKKVES